MSITPDDKDWTWVLERPCPQCGLDAGAVPRADLATRARATVPAWLAVLDRPDVKVRPAPGVWSPLEYACHVRDVHRLFDQRLRLILEQDDPLFANWDQDETAVREQYGDQEPGLVAAELATAGAAIGATFDGVPDDAWGRPGRRSNGSVFTVESLGRYYLHDVVHHLHDVAGKTG